MNSCKPYGNAAKVRVLVIGHDPRLKQSTAQAQYAFFLDYLEEPHPSSRSERRKYELASDVVDYIRCLGGASLSLEDMYFTNLCNEFLERPSGGGTVLIPDEVADRGIHAIEDILSQGSFKVILPMSPQVFYHLVRTGFVTDPDKDLQAFLKRAQPKPAASRKGVYEPSGKSPFLLVCGQEYHHRNPLPPIVPIVHVKQWPLNSRMKPRYCPLMERAKKIIRRCLE